MLSTLPGVRVCLAGDRDGLLCFHLARSVRTGTLVTGFRIGPLENSLTEVGHGASIVDVTLSFSKDCTTPRVSVAISLNDFMLILSFKKFAAVT